MNIQDVQNVEQEILDVIHNVCEACRLWYYLAYGTWLGAVRHGGFIHWDDDVDILMPREDYEKLITVWDQAVPKGYLLQNVRTNPDFTQNFTKIRKDHTTFLQDETERGKSYHKGVFVDIFPGDRVVSSGSGRKFQYVACAVNLLYARGHRELVHNSITGYLIPAGDGDQQSQCIAELTLNEDKRGRMSDEGYCKATKYTIAAVRKELISIL